MDTPRGEIVIYQAENGATDLQVHLEQDTVWLTQKQISELFQTERSVITKHVRNIFSSSELDGGVQILHILPLTAKPIRPNTTTST